MIENAIDEKMQPIVEKLNRLGLSTNFSCQGNHPEDENTLIAYISFAEGISLPQEINEFVKEHNWQVLIDRKEANSYITTVYSVDGDFPEDVEALRRKNDEFINGWKRILKLT